ncbi:metallophosphoesterase family protein [Bizionia sp. KMM 8389]
MATEIKHIGNISGQTLLFGGVYSNLQALEAIKQVAEKHNIPASNCICTGDIIGYCAQPEETITFFKSWNPRSILGNVEIQLIEGSTNCGCNFEEGSRCDSLSQQWYLFAKNKLSENSITYLKTLPEHLQFTFANKNITVVHGSATNTSEFIFKSTPWEKKRPSFELTNSQVVIAGHCGLPFYSKNADNIWLNPGVIGMPANNGEPSVWYAILDDSNSQFTFQFYSLDYDYQLASQLMLKNSLPKSYANTLKTGLWDNMDILPSSEQQQKGLAINF